MSHAPSVAKMVAASKYEICNVDRALNGCVPTTQNSSPELPMMASAKIASTAQLMPGCRPTLLTATATNTAVLYSSWKKF